MDSRALQLRHRLNNLPETAELMQLRTRLGDLERSLTDAQLKVEDLSAEQSKIDTDVMNVRSRKDRDQQRIDSGQVSNPKDIARITDERAALERRISDLEDAELEVMERLETAQGELDRVESEIAEVRSRGSELNASRKSAITENETGLAEVEAERALTVDGIPADLLALYDRIREQKGGIGAAELRRRECGGCRLTLDSAVLATIKSAPVDEVVRCDECMRILVRTSESGL